MLLKKIKNSKDFPYFCNVLYFLIDNIYLYSSVVYYIILIGTIAMSDVDSPVSTGFWTYLMNVIPKKAQCALNLDIYVFIDHISF
jgi:hypothetical protein